MFIAFKSKLEKRTVVSTASTGNAAAALAGSCASAKQSCIIFVPSAAPEAKRTQLAVYGARVVLVKGTYDDAFDLCNEACKKFGWYCRNTGFNPYTAEGKKTVAFEICEQLFRRHNLAAPQDQLVFEAPDVIFVSVGDGNIISGLHKGLRDLHACGFIKKMPRIVGVQAEGSNSIAQVWRKKQDISKTRLLPIDDHTIADSIAAGLPRDPTRAAKAAWDTDGAYIEVSDDEILKAIPALARTSGLFAEPAAATTYAGLLKAKTMKRADGTPFLGKNETLVILSTGNGLKDVVTARKSVAADLERTVIVEKGDSSAVETAFNEGRI
jgi:threonine synthase